MLVSVKEADYHCKKLGKEFDYGDIVGERALEKSRVESFYDRFEKLLPHVVEMGSIMTGDSKNLADEIFQNMAKAKQEVVRLTRKEDAKNKDLEFIVLKLHQKLDRALFLLEQKDEVLPFVNDKRKQRCARDAFAFAATKCKADRDIVVFQQDIRDGSDLLLFKKGIQTKHEVITYGTDPDIEICREAKRAGVDVVAKKGILFMSHHCFDLVVIANDSFSFSPVGDFVLPEETRFFSHFQKAFPKPNGIVIFNVPYYKIHGIARRIKKDLTIEGMYRVDDEMKNVLFVCRYKQSLVNEDLQLRKAMLGYDKLPHYTEMGEFYINKGELTLPKIFRPLFVDDEDIEQAFLDEESSVETAEKFYKPKEEIVELSRPLQKYKLGHLPAVATSGVANGLYDHHACPNLYTTKILRQEVKEEKEEMYKGEMVTIVSEKKVNIIVANALTPDGEIIELLNTKE